MTADEASPPPVLPSAERAVLTTLTGPPQLPLAPGPAAGPNGIPGPEPEPDTVAGFPGDVAAAARGLLRGLVAEPWGQVSPSVYETGRLVGLTPWLSGHGRRVAHLLAAQRPDGAWGSLDDGYALVPTLSATEALLATLDPAPPSATGSEPGMAPDAVRAHAAGRGLHALLRWSDSLRASELPDLPAIELIVPHLVERANHRLSRLSGAPPPGLHPALCRSRLRSPGGMDDTRFGKAAAALAVGAAVPQKLLHALEIAGPAAYRLPSIRPEQTGTIGASPAATAAWLGAVEPAPDDPARRYLETVVDAHGGPVPCGIPITVFERAWVLSTLLRAGIRVEVPTEITAGLSAALGPMGTPAAAGLPADADTTAGTLYALALSGRPRRPDVLWGYDTGPHFCTWPGEDGFSVSTNAHALEAFGQFLAGYVARHGGAPPGADRYRAAVRRIAALLLAHQGADGSWHDRWHASPYYATACCALALNSFGGAESGPALRRTSRWLLETQRSDGSWGRWGGTVEETCYALQILLLVRREEDKSLNAGVSLGYEYLRFRSHESGRPALWHDKDLYLPKAIVQAGLLAAVQLTRSSGLVSPGQFPNISHRASS